MMTADSPSARMTAAWPLNGRHDPLGGCQQRTAAAPPRTLRLVRLLFFVTCSIDPARGLLAIRKPKYSCFDGKDHRNAIGVSVLRMSSSGITSPSSPSHQDQQIHPDQVPSTCLWWNFRLEQLRAFRNQHGHTRVPKRCSDPPGLANWVNKQRQLYKRYVNGLRPCSLDEQRIAELAELGFCWDGRQRREETPAVVEDKGAVSAVNVVTLPEDQPQSDSVWWNYLREFQLANASADEVPAFSGLGKWLRQERRALLDQTLSETKRQALDRVDSAWWMTRPQRAWERQFAMLTDYATLHGDCRVPISYPNRKLAHFVANQRKQYNARCKKNNKNPSALTEERIQRLQSIGFVWNHWEDYRECQQQQQQERKRSAPTN
jgi:hypothetical protein